MIAHHDTDQQSVNEFLSVCTTTQALKYEDEAPYASKPAGKIHRLFYVHRPQMMKKM
jgi:hypothetical protein